MNMTTTPKSDYAVCNVKMLLEMEDSSEFLWRFLKHAIDTNIFKRETLNCQLSLVMISHVTNKYLIIKRFLQVFVSVLKLHQFSLLRTVTAALCGVQLALQVPAVRTCFIQHNLQILLTVLTCPQPFLRLVVLKYRVINYIIVVVQ